MANINEILQRAASLRDETALNSISPERAGGIMYDTLIALNELWLQQGSALVISKIYASVSAMEADTAPVSDLTGQPLRPGQIVVIASSDSDNGSVYRYNGTTSPSWTSVGKIGNLEPVDSLDSDSTSLPLAAHQGKVLDGKISQLGQKVDELENGEKQTLTFLRGSTTISCDFKQGHIYKCKFARYTPYASESPRAMKLTLSASGVTSSYIPTESGVNLAYGESYYFYSPNDYTAAVGYTEGAAEWDIYDITEKYEGVFQMMRDAEYSAGGNAQYDSLGNITQQDIIWSNNCTGILTKTLFDEDVFEYEREEATCINAIAGKFSYKVTFDKNYDEFGNIASESITIAKI